MAIIQNIDLDVNISEVLNQIDEYLIVEHYGKENLLEALGYYKDLCFSTDTQLKNAVERDPESFGIDLKPEYDTINDQDIYDRFVELLSKNKLTYMEWDNFLTKYE